ncbi:MAG: arginine--tRNA ligase [Deltaproteobacteria bacterium]|nr:arginine--tRNA ligase [Deltaproteobacteria bacterium]
MKHVRKHIQELLLAAVDRCVADGLLAESLDQVPIEPVKRAEHGDFATTVALMLAKKAKMPPRKLAEAIRDRIQDDEGWIDHLEVAGPGFVNIRLARDVWYRGLGRIREAGRDWGLGEPKASPKFLIEFVSANPTGPLHVGHGRGAAVGDALGRILRRAGWQASSEYYLNDAGRQVRQLGQSVWVRALEILRDERPEQDPKGQKFSWLDVPAMPEDGYQADYVRDLARALLNEQGIAVLDMAPGEDLGPVAEMASHKMAEAIRGTLERFGVTFDFWVSERSLRRSGAIDRALDKLQADGLIYEKEGARWFRSSRFGDEKDRVVVRKDGEVTYFAADIAYHMDKYDRGFDQLIDVWGADHHGYVPRVKAVVEALGHSPDSFEPLLVQFVALKRGGEKVAMGKRSGNFVTVDDLMDEVGMAAMRYFFLERRHDSHIDFDLEVALSQDPTVNPAVYVQYGHARACGILRKAREELGLEVPSFDLDLVRHLDLPQEIEAIKQMLELPTLVEESAIARQPHRIVSYLSELSRLFQSYYTQTKSDPVLPPPSQREAGLESWDWDRTNARLTAVAALRDVFAICLDLLGLPAPERMASIETVDLDPSSAEQEE